MVYIVASKLNSITYDHRLERTGHPVRSAIHKLQIGGLVVGSVTTSEYPLLYVFYVLNLAFLRLRAFAQLMSSFYLVSKQLICAVIAITPNAAYIAVHWPYTVVIRPPTPPDDETRSLQYYSFLVCKETCTPCPTLIVRLKPSAHGLASLASQDSNCCINLTVV
jgi:hypothetical protein